MSDQPKPPPGEKPNPAFRRAFARLDAALAKASTPSELDISDKLNAIRIHLFGHVAAEVIADENRQEAIQANAGEAVNSSDPL